MSGGNVCSVKDPAIKLFGRTIPLPENQTPAKPSEKSESKVMMMVVCGEIRKSETQDITSEESVKPDNSFGIKDSKEEDQTMSMEENVTRINRQKKENHGETGGNGIDEEKVLKKPDKIIPCPRCNSSETKFCYFNNYNVNQPRYFCKNCQRYWTAGGTMRNVPVGAGRRRHKQLASQFRQILVPSDCVPVTRINISDLGNQEILSNRESPTFSTPSMENGTVLNFGQENREERTSCSSSTTSSFVQGKEVFGKLVKQEQSCLPVSNNDYNEPHPSQCYPVPPLIFTWNPGSNNVASQMAARCSSELFSIPDGSAPTLRNRSNSAPAQWCSTPMLGVHGFFTPSIPLRLVPASIWGCAPVWAAGAGNSPLPVSSGGLSPSSSTITGCSGNISLTLGKHYRDANFLDQERIENSVVAPKTLRIDDSNEGLRSSFWTSLGFDSSQKESISRCGFVESSKPSGEGEDYQCDSTKVLEANPAAHSRFRTFEEST